MMLDHKRLLLVGRHPPPLGGNTIHMERLVRRLLADRIPTTVLDVYNPGSGEADAADPSRLAFVAISGGRGARYVRLFRALRARARDAVVHIHISAGANFYRYARWLDRLTARAHKRVLTIHSGGWVAGFEALSPSQQERALRTIRAFDDLICVNEQQHALLRQRVTSRLHLIPAYLPPPSNEPVALPESVRRLRQAVDVVVVTSGFGTRVYDHETVVRGVQLAQSRVNRKLGLVVATYATWDNAYWGQIVDQLRSSSVPAVTTADLSPPQFLSLLAAGDLYVRGTLADGDAVAIREAASVGTRIIATDAVPRPAGTCLFHSGDAEGLAARIVDALGNPELGRLPKEAFPDNYQEILRVYGAG